MRSRPEFLVIAMLSGFLVGCGQAVDPPSVVSGQCVDIPNGQYFQFVDGRLVDVTQDDIDGQEATARRIEGVLAGMGFPWVTLDWDGQTLIVSGLALNEASRLDAFVAAKSRIEADRVAGPLVQRVVNEIDLRVAEEAIAIRLTEELVEEDGFDWLRVKIQGRVATLIGVAPDAREKQAGYREGRSTVLSDIEADPIVSIVVDAISVAGNGDPVGSALASFEVPFDLASCQAAFNQVMSGRDVAYLAREAIVERASSRLLDAITGVALLCDQYAIEIAVRVGASEGIGDGLDLSQRRASAVRDYLLAYEVQADAVTARGYGRFENATSETAFIVRPSEL